MEFELSFDPLNHNVEDFGSDQLGTLVDVYRPSKFPNLAEADVVIFTVPEFRGAGFESEKGTFFKIKNEFYKLFQGQNRLRIADLGFLKLGNKKEDTYQLLADVLQECNKRGLFALFLGGGQDLTISQYKSFAQSKEFCNMVCVDSKFDLDINNDNINSNSYLSSILNEESSVLFNFSNLGYQSYLVPNSSVDLLNKLFFDVHRIGEIRADFEDIEPVLRDANFVSLDLNSIKLSDFTAVFDGSPNGFTSEEICQLMRYAGIGNKLQSLGIYNYYDPNEQNSMSSKLVAQMIWCFLEGFFHKMKTITSNDKNLVKYHVSMHEGEYNACFYKNSQNNKWWMEIPILLNVNTSFETQCFVPCSYKDYLTASKGDIPERWWKAFQKIN